MSLSVESARALRWLPAQSLLDLYHCVCDNGMQDVSFTTFWRCYREKWRKTLRFRQLSQHSKCTICEKLRLWRARATTPGDTKKVAQAMREHINGVFADRALDRKMMVASEKSCSGEINAAHMNGSDWVSSYVPYATSCLS